MLIYENDVLVDTKAFNLSYEKEPVLIHSPVLPEDVYNFETFEIPQRNNSLIIRPNLIFMEKLRIQN